MKNKFKTDFNHAKRKRIRKNKIGFFKYSNF